MNGLVVGYSSSDESDGEEGRDSADVCDISTSSKAFGGAQKLAFHDRKAFELKRRMHGVDGEVMRLKATRSVKRAHREMETEKGNRLESELSLEEGASSVEADKTPVKVTTSTAPAVFEPSSTLHVPLSRLQLTSAPAAYAKRFAMHAPGFKSYFTPKRLSNSIVVAEGPHAVTLAQFHPTIGHVFITATNAPTGLVQLWDTLRPGKLLREFHNGPSTVMCAQFSEAGTHMVCLTKDGWLRVWNVREGKVLLSSRFDRSTVAKFVPGAQEILLGFEDGHIEQISYATGASVVVQTYTHHHQGPISDLEFIKPWYMPGGETHEGLPSLRFVSSGLDKSVNVWILRFNVPAKHITLKKSVHRVKVNPQASHFVCEEVGGGLLVYTTGSGSTSSMQLSAKIHLSAKAFTNLEGDPVLGTPLNQGPTFSPDGKTLIAGTAGGDVYFWDWRSARVVRTLGGGVGPVSALSVHPLEASMVIVGGGNGALGVLD